MKDSALFVCLFSFNVLRKSSVSSLKSIKVFLKGRSAFVRCTIWERRVAYHEQLVSYHATDDMASSLDLFERWKRHQPSAELFYGSISETILQPQDITHALTHLFEATGVLSPPEGKFISHFLRMGAHTERFCSAFRLKRSWYVFGWARTWHSWHHCTSTKLPACRHLVSSFPAHGTHVSHHCLLRLLRRSCPRSST